MKIKIENILGIFLTPDAKPQSLITTHPVKIINKRMTASIARIVITIISSTSVKPKYFFEDFFIFYNYFINKYQSFHQLGKL